ncbi:DNA replication licensing factor mcm10, partial [Neolecta irregularis DAH-3]
PLGDWKSQGPGFLQVCQKGWKALWNLGRFKTYGILRIPRGRWTEKDEIQTNGNRYRMFSPPKSIAARKSGYSGTSNFLENPFAGTADVQIRLASSQTFVVGPKHQMFDQDGKDSNHLRLAKFRKQQATRERERQVVHKLLQSQNNSVASDYFNAGKQDPVPLDESLNPFSAIALRKIGFDPRRRVGSIPDITKKMTLDEFMRTSPVGIDGDSSDELEIV